MASAREAYLSAIRLGANAAEATGFKRWLDNRRDRGVGYRWARSIFAIYDIEQMVALDIPWWTFEAIERADIFLKSRPGAQVFEYGSGASTIWLARRSASVVSVEHDPQWHPIVSNVAKGYSHAKTLLVPPDAAPNGDDIYLSTKREWRGRSFFDYVHSIEQFPGPFDMIVIDGRARAACLPIACSKLARDGMIVFDNTHRSAYRRAIAASGMHASRTRGFTACLPYPDETTLLTYSR